MNETLNVTIARHLEAADIPLDGSFDHSAIVDLRCDEGGSARPIEETVLRRLRNRFVDYRQYPVGLEKSDAGTKGALCDAVRSLGGEVLLLTTEVATAAETLSAHQVPFETATVYFVETGMGERERSMLTVRRREMAATA